MLRTSIARALLLALAGALLVGAARAADQTPPRIVSDAAQIAVLVKQLGSEEFAQREEATDTLTRIGLPAFAALEGAATSPDREVRFRAVRILGLIRELDMQRRLEAFLSGKEEAGEYALPGWDRFKKTYGDQSATREMFVDMQRADPELMRAMGDGPKVAAEALDRRAAQHQQAMQAGVQQLSLGQITAMLFVATDDEVKPPTQTMLTIFNYCNHQSLRDALDGKGKKEVPRKMVGTLIKNSEDWAAYQAMILAYNNKLPEGLVPALKILGGQGARASHMSQYALLTVARNGDQSHLPLVEKLLEDKAVVTRMQENNKMWDVQVRDAALAAAILLTKQELKSYFTGRPEQTVSDPQQIFFNPRLIGFQSETDREVVQKKWTAWRAANPAKPVGEKPAAEKPAP